MKRLNVWGKGKKYIDDWDLDVLRSKLIEILVGLNFALVTSMAASNQPSDWADFPIYL